MMWCQTLYGPLSDVDRKLCTVCGMEKLLTDYYRRGNGVIRSECKKCHNKRDRRKEKRREMSRLRMENNARAANT